MSDQVAKFTKGSRVEDATKKNRGKGVVELVEAHPDDLILPDQTYLILWDDGTTEAQVAPSELRPE